MAIPSSGPISLTTIQTEFGGSAPTSLNEYYAGGAYVPAGTSGTYGAVPSSGQISLRNFYGTSNTFIAAPITTSQQQLNLRTWALANGWDGTSALSVAINSGVYIWSDNTTIAALTIAGSFPNGVTVINNGYIMGSGGKGGNWYFNSSSPTMYGQNGGPAIGLGAGLDTTAIVVNNSGAFIAGGGGGGSSGGFFNDAGNAGGGGGGAGGGAGGDVDIDLPGLRYYGGAGGAIGAAGQNGVIPPPGMNDSCSPGGGGGRILPGVGGIGGYGSNDPFNRTNGYGRGGGAGGGGGIGSFVDVYPPALVGNGGTGGNGGNAGGSAVIYADGGSGGGGGGWGAAGGPGKSAGGGTVNRFGQGGKAVALNGFLASISGLGTIYGAIS